MIRPGNLSVAGRLIADAGETVGIYRFPFRSKSSAIHLTERFLSCKQRCLAINSAKHLLKVYLLTDNFKL